MQMNFMRKIVIGLALTAGICTTTFAQSTTQGAISGTVTDTTGAVVPNATVLIHSENTGADVKLTSGDSGFYKAPQLAPGTYTVTVSAAGFSELKSTGVLVQVQGVTEVVSKLTTGSENSVVEVTADVPVIRFDTAEYGGHLSNNEIENIPINNRRWSSLALTTPGVTNDTSGFGLLSFRAISSVLNNVQIDGTDDNQAFFSEERGRTRAGYSTSQAAVREFQVNTGVYSAEFGRAVGGVVNSVTKSGGNQIHGEAYFYRRDDFLSSINPKVKIAVSNGAGGFNQIPYRPKDKRNQYGFGVGGPLIKDKLFGFYAFDAFKRNFPGVGVPTDPTAFYATNTTGIVVGTTTIVTAAQYNAAMADLGTDLGNVPRYGNQNINTPKLDWQINSKHHLALLYHRLRWDSPAGVQTQAALNYSTDAFGNDFVKLDYGFAKLDSILSDHFSNELRYQYGRELNYENQQPYTSYTRSHFVQADGRVAQVNINNGVNGFIAGSPYYAFRTAYPDERKWQVGDTASYQFGKHNLRFGIDYIHNYDLQQSLGASGTSQTGTIFYNSLNNYVADIVKPSGACALATGSTPAITAAGGYACYTSIGQAFGRPNFDLVTSDYAGFVQDDWKVTPRLTLNIGARYDIQVNTSQYGFLVNSEVPQTGNTPSDKNNIAPRLGFAFDPFGLGKTVIRGGFGFYYGRTPNNLLLDTYINSGASGGQFSLTYYNSTNGSLKFPNTLPSVAGPAGGSIKYFDANYKNPYAQQFDLVVQQDLGKANVLSVAYIGSLSRQLPNYLNLNLDPTKTFTQTYTVAPVAGTTNCGLLVCGSKISTKVYSNRTVTSTGTVPNTLNTHYNAVTDVISNINASYNALTVDITNRQWKFITFDASYTWAHALDFNQQSVTQASANNWFDPYGNARANYGNSSLNVRHRAVGWAILNIPGIKSSHSALSYATNGWSIKPLVQMQTGLPFTPSINGTGGTQTVGCAAITATTGCFIPYSSGLGGTGVSYIPQIGRNTSFGPRNILIDTRVQKDVKLHERYTLQLIAEAFNLANHQNVTGLNTNAYALSGTTLTPVANYGTPSSSGVNANYAYGVRQFQFSGRIVF